MRIAVFGATGMVGSAIASEALAREHAVLALARHPEAGPTINGLSTQACDVRDSTRLEPILSNTDVAVLTIRLEPGHENQLAPLTLGFMDVASATGTRVLVIGGASPLRSPRHPHRIVLDEKDYVPDEYQALARASLAQLKVCTDHPHREWVYLSPPAMLEPGTRTGRYRRGTTTLLTDENGISRITVSDLAIAAIDELEHPSGAHHFTVAAYEPDHATDNR